MKDEGRGVGYDAGEGAGDAAWRVGEGEDLRGRTKQFALRVIRLFAALPKSAVAQVLGKQLLRSATSVGANYREACRSRSDSEFIAKLGDCLKELEESLYWLELLADSETLPATKLSALLRETDELLAIFTAIVRGQKARLLVTCSRAD